MRVDREKRRRVFFDEHDAIIREHYACATLEDVGRWAKEWDVSRDAIRNRALTLGVRRTEAAKALAQTQAAHQRYGSLAAYEPPVANRDDEHVAACIAEGGFVRAELVKGRTVWVRSVNG